MINIRVKILVEKSVEDPIFFFRLIIMREGERKSWNETID